MQHVTQLAQYGRRKGNDMLKNLLKYLKGVIDKMFKKDTLQNVVKRNIAISDAMAKRIEYWDNMLNGKAEWVGGDVVSMRLEQAICKEFADVVLSEMESSVSDETIDELYKNAIKGMSEELQKAFALGGFVIKPIGLTGEVEFISADKIIPIEFNAKKRLIKAGFLQVKRISKDDVFYRVELHELVPEGLRISNRAFHGKDGEIGREIGLESVDEWANLISDVTYKGMDRMDFGYYRNPLPNTVDGSENGVSVYESAIEQIKRADKQYSRIEWEFDSAERAVFADWTTVQKNGSGFSMPQGKKRLFIPLDTGDNDGVTKEYSPSIREQNFINGLNEYLRRVEFNVGLAYGDLSKSETVEKTATEIKASKLRKYNSVNAIQTNLKDCLEDLVYAIAFYQSRYKTNFEFNCVFHDSILTDETQERAQDRLDMASGIMSRLEYRMKWYGEDEETAKRKLAEIMDISSIDENQ